MKIKAAYLSLDTLSTLTAGIRAGPDSENRTEVRRLSAGAVTSPADWRNGSDGSSAETSRSDGSISVTEVGPGAAASVTLVSRWGRARLVRVELSSVAETFGSGLGNLDVSASFDGASGNVAKVGAGCIGTRSFEKKSFISIFSKIQGVEGLVNSALMQ